MFARERHEVPLLAIGVHRDWQAGDDAQKRFSFMCRQSAPSLADEEDITNLKEQQGRPDRRLAAEAFDSLDRAWLTFIGEGEAREDRGVDNKAGQYL